MRRKTLGTLVGLALCVGVIFGIQYTPDHKLLFEKAKFAMETKGDLQAAVKLFQEIVAKYPQEKEYAAKAQLYIGLCYEKLGNSEAVRAYELVLKNFADRPEEVAVARERLAALSQEEGGGIIKKNLPISEIDFRPYALSPDGTKILGISSDTGDNVALLDIATGRTELVTHYDFRNESYLADTPVWSPDGKEIAYIQYSQRDDVPDELRVISLDGKSRLLLRVEDGVIYPCDWLRNGSGLVVIRAHKDKSQTLGLITLPGGTLRSLCPIPASNSYSVTSSPDGRLIAFSKTHGNNRNIYIYSFTRQQSYVLIDHPADDTSPLWSPDGKYLAFLSDRHGLWALWGLEMKEGRAAGEPFMIKEAHAGSLLNWTSHGLACYENLDFYDIYVHSFDLQARELVGKPQILSSTPVGGNFCPRWSPNGAFLAYFSRTATNPPQEKIVVIASGGGEAREFKVPAPALSYAYLPFQHSLSWLADGSGIWFTMFKEGFDRVLFRGDLASGEWKTRVLPEAAKGSPSIILDRTGGSIIYGKGSSQERDPGIIENNLGTGEERYIYRPERSNNIRISGLRFSSDFRSLAFMQAEYDKPGENPRTLFQVVDMESGRVRTAYTGQVELGELVFSPDGRDLMVHGLDFDPSGYGKALAVIPSAGGPPKKLKIEMSWPQGLELSCRLVSHDWSPDGKQIAFTVYSLKEEMFLLRNIIPKDRK